MVLRSTLSFAALVAFLPAALAQTFTLCNPMERDDCPTNPALSTNVTFDWTGNKETDDMWNTTAGKVYEGEEGQTFTVAKKGDSPTIQTNFYIFWGVVSVVMKAAPGQGIVSSMVLQSENLDEIDWEFIGGNNTHVQTNYFGKGNTQSYNRSAWHLVDNPQGVFHNYTVHWTKEAMDFYVNDDKIRTITYEQSDGNGAFYPQTPMNIRLGIWAGGDPDNEQGVIDWAGGLTDFEKAPYTMTIQNVYIKDFSTAKEYKYGDRSGSFESIELIQGKSEAAEYKEAPKTVSEKFDRMPRLTKIGVIAGGVGAAVLLLGAIAFVCFRQRKRGRNEAARMAELQRQQEAGLLAYKA